MSNESGFSGGEKQQTLDNGDSPLGTPIMLPQGQKLSEKEREHFERLMRKLEAAKQEQKEKQGEFEDTTEQGGKWKKGPEEDDSGMPQTAEDGKIEKLRQGIDCLKNDSVPCAR